MKHQVIYLDEKPILDYLSMHGHGADSKDYELAISIWVKRLYEQNSNKDYCIAFELKDALSKFIQHFDSNNTNHVKKVLENNRVENTLLDLILVEGKAASPSKSGWGFQLKRFGKGINENFTQELTNRINHLI